MDYAILSPLETLPFEVINKIFAWLKKSPWKLPLGQCSKRLYGVFVSHIEKRKGDILKSYRCMRYAAIWGDPILTQIPLNYDNFGFNAFVDVCISGNLELTKYVDAYLVLIAQTSNNKKELNLGKQVRRWRLEALKALLRLNTFSRVISISIERLDEFIHYFFEELKGPEKDKLILCLSGIIEVYGKETCLFPMFKDYMLRHNDDGNKQRRIRTLIKEEYFYLGDIEKAQTIEWPFYNFNYDMPRDKVVMENVLKNCETVHVKCLKSALRSPKQNTEAITVAWNAYKSWGDDKCSRIKHSMRINFWPIAIYHHKSEIFYDLTHEYLKDHDIDLDYYRLWIYNFRTNQSHIELWNLDPKTCLIRILSESCAKESVSFKRYDTFKRLLKYYPDIMKELSVEQRNLYQYLGLFCPRCLKRIIKQSNNVNEDHYCRYCKYTFPSIDDNINKKS